MSTAPDGLFQYGGVPVGGGRYEGMWGGKVYFVDYDSGNDAHDGRAPNRAFKYLDTALSAATAWDVIYVRPRTPDTTGGDPQSMLPSSSTNFSISLYQARNFSDRNWDWFNEEDSGQYDKNSRGQRHHYGYLYG